jgi:hypothetical protein
MAESGLIRFGSHTHTHRQFRRQEKFQDWETELRHSKALIEENLKQSCLDFSWPWGQAEPGWQPHLKNCGYRTAFTTQRGWNAPGMNPHHIHRLDVRKGAIGWLSSRLSISQNRLLSYLFGFNYGWDKRIKKEVLLWLHRRPSFTSTAKERSGAGSASSSI